MSPRRRWIHNASWWAHNLIALQSQSFRSPNGPSTLGVAAARRQFEIRNKGFVDLLDGLVGKLNLRKRFLNEKNEKDYSNSKIALIMVGLLEKATDICTTADMWTTHCRSYIGMTVHWHGYDLKRRSACLAICRIKGSHTFPHYATTNEIHMEFRILGKVNAIIIWQRD